MMQELTSSEIATLLYKRLQGTLEPEEEERLHTWEATSTSNAKLSEELYDEEVLAEWLRHYHPENKATRRHTIYAKIQARVPILTEMPIRILPRWMKYAAAAVVLLVGISLAYYYQLEKERSLFQKLTYADKEVDQLIHPGKEGAILKLSNGETIELGREGNRTLSSEEHVSVRLEDGKLTYTPQAEIQEATSIYHAVMTPRGRQFQVQLPDGTRVWLNASSSISYPVSFDREKRMVKVAGEAYFEVSHNNKQPFFVELNDGSKIEVLGTHFNVQAYPDEKKITTTLLEGAIRFNGAVSSQSVTLSQPGQQALRNEKGRVSFISQVDMGSIMAWRSGMFSFHDIDLKEVMRQLSRWYDIDVVFDHGIPDIKLEGELQREASFSSVLLYLEKIGVHSKVIDGELHVINE